MKPWSMILCFGLSMCGVSESAWDMDSGDQYKDVPAPIREWFKSVRSSNGIPCCDVADGHHTQVEQRDGSYWVPIEGEWYKVPPEAVVNNAKNPTGDAIVWYVKNGDKSFYIRCFVLGLEV